MQDWTEMEWQGTWDDLKQHAISSWEGLSEDDLDVAEGDKPQPIPFFTNSVGRFAIANLLPGRRYLVETYGPNGTIDRSFDFAVPADSDGLVNLGTVQPGSSN